MAQNKDNKEAEKLRNEGNVFFKHNKHFDALLKYNESLCRSENGSVNIPLAYANRSAVFMELKMYEKCLKNIQQAKDAGYPQDKMETLNSRNERASLMLTKSFPAAPQESDPFKFIHLSYPANPKNPEIVDRLELAENEKYGRHIIASKDLKAGDVIAIEKHAVKILHHDLLKKMPKDHIYYQFCAHCLDTNKLDLIQCDGCVKSKSLHSFHLLLLNSFLLLAMYCSDECKKRHYEESHRYECAISDKLHNLPNSMALTLNVFFKGLAACDDSIDELEKLVAGHLYGKEKSSVFDFDFTNMSDKEAAKANLLIILSGAAHTLTNQQRTIFLSETISVLESQSIGYKLLATHRSFLEAFMLKVFSINLINVYSLKKPDLDPLRASEGLSSIGNGNSLFSSLISHSCAPNIATANVGDKCVIIMIEPIKKGDQVFITYG